MEFERLLNHIEDNTHSITVLTATLLEAIDKYLLELDLFLEQSSVFFTDFTADNQQTESHQSLDFDGTLNHVKQELLDLRAQLLDDNRTYEMLLNSAKTDSDNWFGKNSSRIDNPAKASGGMALFRVTPDILTERSAFFCGMSREIEERLSSFSTHLDNIKDKRFCPPMEEIAFSANSYKTQAHSLLQLCHELAQDYRKTCEYFCEAEASINDLIYSRDGVKTLQQKDIDLHKVEFSAIASKTLIKGDYSIINVIMYEPSSRHIVDRIICEAGEPTHETRSGTHNVQDGSHVKVILDSPDIKIDDNVETGTWQGEYLDFSFVVSLPDHYEKRQVLFIASVYINDVIATKLKFIIKCSSLLEHKIDLTREDILSAFVSYASQDRNRVATIIQGMKKARPDMDIFFDVDSLRCGEDWRETLLKEIEDRDILFLCWSHFARDSKWVDREWRYALERKGEDHIEPIPIESPEDCPPPQELKHKHFNDNLLYIINASN